MDGHCPSVEAVLGFPSEIYCKREEKTVLSIGFCTSLANLALQHSPSPGTRAVLQ